jgi:pimeloyl-ACP methyl ester carboxylesterase
MPTPLIVLLIAIGAGIFIVFGGAFGIALYAIRPKRRTPAQLADEELILKQVPKELYDIPYEELTIKSDYGYDIYARAYFEFKDSHRYAVLVHGHNAASSGVVRFMDIFRSRGINTLLPDNRYSARTGGKCISFGYFEKFDVIKCIDYIYSQDSEAQIGIFGESMGGATAIMVAARRPDLKFCIDYCGYSSMDAVLKDAVKNIAPPAIAIYPLVRMFMPLVGGFKISDVNPAKDAKIIKMPVLMLHSRADKFVPFYHRDRIRENLPGGADVVEFEKSGHGLSLNTYPEQFREGVNKFLEKVGF